MFKHTLTYENFNGETVTEDFYFNISKSELVTKQAVENYQERLVKMVESKDRAELVQELRAFILMCIGEKSEDGRLFKKTPEIRENFQYSAAFDALLIKFFEDETFGAHFVSNVLPSELREKMPQDVMAQVQKLQDKS